MSTRREAKVNDRTAQTQSLKDLINSVITAQSLLYKVVGDGRPWTLHWTLSG
jgi:hypothetical protein